VEQTYTVVLKNDSKKPVVLYERSGVPLGMLAPGEEQTIETPVAEVIYARWTLVRFLEGGEVQLTENPDWPKPTGRWVLEVVNRDGLDLEERFISGKRVLLPRNIPRLVEVEVADPLAQYVRMEIRRVQERRQSPIFPDYNTFVDVLKDEYIDRPESEIQELAIELEKLATSIEEVEHVEHV